MEKSGDATDFTVECVATQGISVQPGDELEVSAWVRAEGFQGFVSLRAEWLARAQGEAVLARETGPLREGKSSWERIEHRFAVPQGATAFRLGLAAIGREGRVLWDGARVVSRKGGEPRPLLPVGSFRVRMVSSGTFALFDARGAVAREVGLSLISLRDGESFQDAGRGGETLVLNGRIVNPADLGETEFLQEIAAQEDAVRLRYSLSAGNLASLDRVVCRMALPRGTEVRGIPGGAEGITVQLRWSLGSSEFILDHDRPVRVRVREATGATVLEQEFPDAEGDRREFGCLIRLASGGDSMDPREAARRAIERGNPGEALRTLRRAIGATRDPREAEEIRNQVEKLERDQANEWDAARSAAFQARMSLGAPDVEGARGEVSRFQRRWSGGDFDDAASSLQDLLARLLQEAAGEEREDRAGALVEQARGYAAMEWAAVAEMIEQTVRRRFGETRAAERIPEPDEGE